MGRESPVKLWLLENAFPFDTNVTTDMNGDGVSLLMAYALNLNPRSNLGSSMPLPGFDRESHTITFYAASAGITYRVETSGDLGVWTTDGLSISPLDSNGFRAASVPSTAPGGFIRLVVSE